MADTDWRKRRTQVLESPQTGPDKFVAELEEIANGGYRPAVRGRSHRWSPFRTIQQEGWWKHDLDDQLDAIRQLGDSGSERALQFLIELYNPSKEDGEAVGIEGHSPDQGPHEPAETFYAHKIVITYANARGPLASALAHTVTPIKIEPQSAFNKGYDYEKGQSTKNQTVHGVVEGAIQRLRLVPEETRLFNARVGDLIDVVEGGLKGHKRPWYAFGFRIEQHYDLDDQLAAIRQLGLSESPRALDYVKSLLVRKYRTSPVVGGFQEHYSRKNAKWGLAGALSVSLERVGGGEPPDWIRIPSHYVSSIRAITRARKNLESALQVTSP
tara:strand:+ start:938 stop:1918 length:981 start_codon:yes stop_codon:yes gene_type:complete